MKNAVCLIIAVLLSLPLIAQTVEAKQVIDSQVAAKNSQQIDSFLQKAKQYITINQFDSAEDIAFKAAQLAHNLQLKRSEAEALFVVGDIYAHHKKYKQALSQFLKSLSIKSKVKNKRFVVGVYYRLANMFAQLRLYPQALKYYYKMISVYDNAQAKNKYLVFKPTQNWAQPDTNIFLPTDTLNFASSLDSIKTDQNGILPDVDSTTLNVLKDSVEMHDASKEVEEELHSDDLYAYFNDGKKSSAYGVMVHVQQPERGKRVAFKLIGEVGHVFVTLTKFNEDSSIKSKTFGFYPKKQGIFDGTPFVPSAESMFKNDIAHEWDEVVGKFITKKKFDKILRLIADYSDRKYNLNDNNCTDFGLEVAKIAGLKIQDTKSYWLIGGGNTPGDTGQSILEGKIHVEKE